MSTELYYVCREPAVGHPQNDQPVPVGYHTDFNAAQSYCDRHNLTAGPGLRLYVVPASLMWTNDQNLDTPERTDT